MTLRRSAPLELPSAVAAPAPAAFPVTVPAGTRARLLLLSTIDSGEVKTGDTYEAKLLEPIIANGQLLMPEGAVLEGRIRKAVAPKRMSRGGTLVLGFDGVRLDDGSTEKINAAVAGVEAEKSS